MKLNKKHGGKEFKNFFRAIGKIKPVRKKEDDNWVDVPYFETTITKTDKERRVLQFIVETTKNNDLRVELAGMESPSAFAYSSTHKKTHTLKWEDRLDKEKYPDSTYHLIETDWDKTERLAELVVSDQWVDVRGYYEFNTLTNEEGQERKFVKRVITDVLSVEDGQEIKVNGNPLNYVCDFGSPDFVEVNYFDLEIGIKSTYQDEETGDTKVNAVVLSYGKEHSTVNDAEFIVYKKEAKEGKVSLADAFNSLNRLDFIEVLGTDNNRAVMSQVEVEDEPDIDDPFANLDDGDKTVRAQWLITGTKKGLEITGYVAGTLQRELLTEEEIEPEQSLDDIFNDSGSDFNFELDL